MLLAAMAARRLALSDPVASLRRQVSLAARRSCPRVAEGFSSSHRTIKSPEKVASVGWRAPVRWFSTGFPPPGAIRAPVAQISYSSKEEMETDSYISGTQFMREEGVFVQMNRNPLLKGKVPGDLVSLGKIRAFTVSSMGIIYDNHKHGISVGISFTKENVEISLRYSEARLKEAWGYRLDPSKGITLGSAYAALARRINNMVREILPDIRYPLCYYDLLHRMRKGDANVSIGQPMTEEMEIHLLHHASLLAIEDYIRFMTEMEILFKHKLPLFLSDPGVHELLRAVFQKVANLKGYDGLYWLQSIGKHRFLEESYEFSERSRAPEIHDPEDLKAFSVSSGMTAMRTNGGLDVAFKSQQLVGAGQDFKRLALKHISIQRTVVSHLYQEILQIAEIADCMPYSREDVAAAVRAVLPHTAVAIQAELFDRGWFTEIRIEGSNVSRC